MSAAILREAARLMRERAEAALPEDATTRDGEITFTWAEQIGHMFNERCAPHFVGFARPAVALAVADWLDAIASEHRPHPAETWGLISWDYCAAGCRELRLMDDGHKSIAPAEWPCKAIRPALAVARAYLNTEGASDAAL